MSPFHPWRLLRQMGREVEIVWDLPPGELVAGWCAQTRKLHMQPGTMNQAERRCSAAHELIHIERGDTECDPSVHKEAARRLIDLNDLAEAIAFHGEDVYALAVELWVDEDTLRTRLDHLHPAERGLLTRRLSMIERSA